MSNIANYIPEEIISIHSSIKFLPHIRGESIHIIKGTHAAIQHGSHIQTYSCTYQALWSRAWRHSGPWWHGPAWILPTRRRPLRPTARSLSPPAMQKLSPGPEIENRGRGRWEAEEPATEQAIFHFLRMRAHFRSKTLLWCSVLYTKNTKSPDSIPLEGIIKHYPSIKTGMS